MYKSFACERQQVGRDPFCCYMLYKVTDLRKQFTVGTVDITSNFSGLNTKLDFATKSNFSELQYPTYNLFSISDDVYDKFDSATNKNYMGDAYVQSWMNLG